MIQNKRSQWLPHFIRDWSFLPLWMRSLQPMDDFFSQLSCCSKCINPPQDSNPVPDVESPIIRVNSGNHEKSEFHHLNHMEEMQVLVNYNEKQKTETEAAISRQEA